MSKDDNRWHYKEGFISGMVQGLTIARKILADKKSKPTGYHWHTWFALADSIDFALEAEIERRKAGRAED